MSYEVETTEVENTEAVEAVEIEVEQYDESEIENMYVEHLDEETVTVCGQEFNPSYILEELDPTAYRCGLNDFEVRIQEYNTMYKCPICGSDDFEDDDEAKFCCQDEYIEKYEVDGDIYDDEDEAQDQADFLNETEEDEA